MPCKADCELFDNIHLSEILYILLYRVLFSFVNNTRLIFSPIVDIIKQSKELLGGGIMKDNDLCLQEIGQRIIERRKKLGLTQEALAEKGDVTTQFVSYAESGKRAMRPENLLKISSALEVSADYLLTGDIVDKDLLLLSNKMRKLTPSQLRIVENVIDECNTLFTLAKESIK